MDLKGSKMVSIYKSLLAVYFSVGVLCLIGGGIFLNHFPDASVVYFVLLIAILFVTIKILTRIAKRRFQRDALSLLDNCNVRAYLEALTRLIGKKRGKRFVSMYSSLSALGYDVLGDYDSLYSSCMNIKDKTYMPFYHRRMFTYYIKKNELDKARGEREALQTIASATKNKAVLKMIEGFVTECDYSLKFHTGDLEGVEEYYTEMLNKEGNLPLITRVSYACVLSEVLIAKNRKEEAKDHLIFVSSRGGDTKYKKLADKLLAEW